jgi:hypothetical protein
LLRSYRNSDSICEGLKLTNARFRRVIGIHQGGRKYHEKAEWDLQHHYTVETVFQTMGISEMGVSEMGVSEMEVSEMEVSEMGVSEMGVSEMGV